MKQYVRTTAVLIVAAVVISLVGQRLVGAEFTPAAAHEPTSAGYSVVPTRPTVTDLAADEASLQPVRGRPAGAAAGAVSEPAAAEAPLSVPVTAAEATVAPVTSSAPAAPRPAAPQPTVRPAPTSAPAPTAPSVPTAVPTTVPPTCPATWFCYPRLGIAGAIVPYTDCSGSTDVGTSIRSFLCLSPFYLMGHAYTQFGQIVQWRAGDVVFASGRQFTITGAFTQSSCAPPAQAIAPLSLQTSLTSGGCGSVLVVQGK